MSARLSTALLLLLYAAPAAAQAPLVVDLSGLELELPARPTPPRLAWLPVTTTAALSGHVADLVTSLVALQHADVYEANPALAWLQRHPVGFTTAKLVPAVLLNWWLWTIAPEHPRFVRWMQVAQAIGFGAVALSNARVR